MALVFIFAVSIVVYGLIAGIVYAVLKALNGFYSADEVYIAGFWPFFVPFLLGVEASNTLGKWLSDRRHRREERTPE